MYHFDREERKRKRHIYVEKERETDRQTAYEWTLVGYFPLMFFCWVLPNKGTVHSVIITLFRYPLNNYKKKHLSKCLIRAVGGL